MLWVLQHPPYATASTYKLGLVCYIRNTNQRLLRAVTVRESDIFIAAVRDAAGSAKERGAVLTRLRISVLRFTNQRSHCIDHVVVEILCSQIRSLHPVSPTSIYTLVRILCTLLVTSCTAERSFSAVKRIKTALRASMATRRLTALSLLHVHRDEFARRHPRRLRMANIHGRTVTYYLAYEFSCACALCACACALAVSEHPPNEILETPLGRFSDSPYGGEGVNGS